MLYANNVFFNNIARVIGPTPPGTGVIHDAFSFTFPADLKYSEDAQREFVALQNKYDSHRNENVRELDDRFKVMMV